MDTHAGAHIHKSPTTACTNSHTQTRTHHRTQSRTPKMLFLNCGTRKKEQFLMKTGFLSKSCIQKRKALSTQRSISGNRDTGGETERETKTFCNEKADIYHTAIASISVFFGTICQVAGMPLRRETCMFGLYNFDPANLLQKEKWTMTQNTAFDGIPATRCGRAERRTFWPDFLILHFLPVLAFWLLFSCAASLFISHRKVSNRIFVFVSHNATLFLPPLAISFLYKAFLRNHWYSLSFGTRTLARFFFSFWWEG